MEKFLKKIGVYDLYIKNAIEYQRLPDGRIFSFPNQFVTEMTWYNVDIFNKYGLKAPKTFDEWIAVCRTLKANYALCGNGSIPPFRKQIHHGLEYRKGKNV